VAARDGYERGNSPDGGGGGDKTTTMTPEKFREWKARAQERGTINV
jgi:hypothetical protein